jgi:hypothetical protein
MYTAKEEMLRIIMLQPDENSYEEILHELAFTKLIAVSLRDTHEKKFLKIMEEKS